MTPGTSRRTRPGVGREVAEGVELIARDWAGRIAMFTGLLLVLVAALKTDADPALRVAGVAAGVVVVAAVVVGWWRKAPGIVQWPVAVVGVVLTVALLVVVGRA
jgi:hypothetical protein